MNLTETWKIFRSSSWKYIYLGIKPFLSFENKFCIYVVRAKSFKGMAFAVPKLLMKESVIILNFINLDEINKLFIKFLTLLNKSLFGIPSDDCVWGFKESVIHSLVTSHLKKKINKRKNFVKSKNWLFSSDNFLVFLLLYCLHFCHCKLP